MSASAPSGDLHQVTLVDLPVEVHRRASEHAQGLQREFDLIRRRDPDPDEVPSRLFVLIDVLTAQFGGLNLGAEEELQAAMERHDATVDLVYHLPLEAIEACQQLGDLLDEADDYCRGGAGLLTLATPPESLAYRRWFLGEFVRQLGGAEPRPWPGFTPGDDPGAHPTAGATVEGATVEADPGPPTAEGAVGDDCLGSWSIAGSPDEPVLAVTGEIDLATSRRLRDVLFELQAAGAQTLTVDLGGVAFLDSVGVSVLVTAHLRLADSGAPLVLVVGPEVHRVLEVAGLTEVLTVRRRDGS